MSDYFRPADAEVSDQLLQLVEAICSHKLEPKSCVPAARAFVATPGNRTMAVVTVSYDAERVGGALRVHEVHELIMASLLVNYDVVSVNLCGGFHA